MKNLGVHTYLDNVYIYIYIHYYTHLDTPIHIYIYVYVYTVRIFVRMCIHLQLTFIIRDWSLTMNSGSSPPEIFD